jgi:hypothetical protein
MERAAEMTARRRGREKKMISRSLTRRVEHLEYRFELVGEPVSEPTIINVQREFHAG